MLGKYANSRDVTWCFIIAVLTYHALKITIIPILQMRKLVSKEEKFRDVSQLTKVSMVVY